MVFGSALTQRNCKPATPPTRFTVLLCGDFFSWNFRLDFSDFAAIPCLDWFASMVPILWIVQQLFVFLSRYKG